MQISPTSTSSVTISTNTSARHPIPSRLGQGVQRSASSCDVENRPGPIKRLKPSLPAEHTTTTTTVHAIATVKQYHPVVRRPLTSTQSTPTTVTSAGTRSVASKTSVPSKTRSTPVHAASNRTIHSPKTIARSTTKPKPVLVSPPPPPPPPRSATHPRKKNQSIFGEKFSDDTLKINLPRTDLKDLDDDARTEILIQFGSIEKFLHEQRLFVASQQQQQSHVKLSTDNKIGTNRSRLQLLIPKKDRLELL